MSGEETRGFLFEHLRAQYGDVAENIFRGFRERRVTSFRVNTLKSSAERIKSALFYAEISYRQVDWYPDAFCIHSSDYEKLVHLPIYDNGEIYVQSLSSMLPPLFLDPQAGERILDMTAAPGSKTTQLFALSNGRALITACERDARRFERLGYNLKKQGAQNVVAMRTDASLLSEYFRFDKILLDAPCTSSGTWSYGKAATFDERLLERCLKAQRTLLKKAVSLLRPGGVLLYSTCSLFKEENEEQALFALENFPCRIEPLGNHFPLPTLPCAENMITVCPNADFEGFFLVKLTKLTP